MVYIDPKAKIFKISDHCNCIPLYGNYEKIEHKIKSWERITQQITGQSNTDMIHLYTNIKVFRASEVH